MVEIARPARAAIMGSEYEAFLYATIGSESYGNTLSVLSAMARMNIDPWREAASLAGLSGKAAANRLATLIAALPGRPSAPDEAETTATRLIKLLPQQNRLTPALPQRSRLNVPPYLPGLIKIASSKGLIYLIILALALALGAQWLAARQPPATSSAVSETATRPNVPVNH